MMKCIAAAAFTIAVAISLIGCGSYNEGETIGISLTGQPSPIGLTTSSVWSEDPSLFYSGSAQELILTYNVLEAPSGGSVAMTPQRTFIITVATQTGVITAPTVSSWTFDRPGTYVVQGVLQESGTNSNESTATDTTTFVITGPATD